jgi:hypothetical protein
VINAATFDEMENLGWDEQEEIRRAEETIGTWDPI